MTQPRRHQHARGDPPGSRNVRAGRRPRRPGRHIERLLARGCPTATATCDREWTGLLHVDDRHVRERAEGGFPGRRCTAPPETSDTTAKAQSYFLASFGDEGRLLRRQPDAGSVPRRRPEAGRGVEDHRADRRQRLHERGCRRSGLGVRIAGHDASPSVASGRPIPGPPSWKGKWCRAKLPM
jgi:hypothetical protein